LDNVQEFLAKSGIGALLLKKRLELVAADFDYCLVDSPPQRSQICLTTTEAAEGLVIPIEATVKGYGSLTRTIDLVEDLESSGVFTGKMLGIMPFRARWIGSNQTQESKMCIGAMQEYVGDNLVLPSMKDSERIKQALNQRKTPADLGYPDLEYPLEVLTARIKELKP